MQGKFGFLFLTQLLYLWRKKNSGLPPVKYIMTDFTIANVGIWRKVGVAPLCFLHCPSQTAVPISIRN